MELSSIRLVEGLVGESGEFDLTWLMVSSDREFGDMASGLAMRKPPRDCDKLRSPSMLADSAADNAADARGLPRRLVCLDRRVKRHMGGEMVSNGKG